MIKLSIIIPAYNSEKYLDDCLRAVSVSLQDDMELIVVDDASIDQTALIATKYSCELLQLRERGGAGKARNEGAKKAKGEFLLFLDSDVIVRGDTFEKLLAVFNKRPEIASVSAIYDRQVYEPGFFQSFKALEETCKYQAYTADSYNSFDPHCACIRREVFFKVGGFVELYKSAEIEDVEFGYRLSREYINCIEPSITVRHIYASFFRSWWNYCRRAFHWTRLFLKHRHFDQAVTTKENAFSVFLAGMIGFSFLSVFFWKPFAIGYTFLIVIFMMWNIRFFYLVLNHEKFGFLKIVPFSFFMVVLQLGVSLGAGAGFLFWSFFHKATNREPLKALENKQEEVVTL